MVSRTGLVTNKVIEVEEQIAQDDLQACANYLNAHFAGLDLSAIQARLLDLMTPGEGALRLAAQERRLRRRAGLRRTGRASLYLDGTVEHPRPAASSRTPDRMRALFKTFEEKSRLVKILNACLSGAASASSSATRTRTPTCAPRAMVVAGYPVDGEAGWGLGVLGTTRMEYARVIALVDHMARPR